MYEYTCIDVWTAGLIVEEWPTCHTICSVNTMSACTHDEDCGGVRCVVSGENVDDAWRERLAKSYYVVNNRTLNIY